MNELKVTGKEKIGSIEFTGIEGGFGEDKKAMLVKDIADSYPKYDTRDIDEFMERHKI